MLNLEAGSHPLAEAIEVNPSNKIFKELGKNTYDYTDLLSELIDNSLAATPAGQTSNIRITIGICQTDPTRNWLMIADNASGIPPERLGLAITPAGDQATGSLNEHGLGMKQAVAGLGELKYLATKTVGEQRVRVIEEFRYGQIYPKLVEAPWEHGTEIVVEKINPIVKTHQQHYTRDLVPYLGARYRRFLMGEQPRAVIELSMVDIEDINDDEPRVIQDWKVEAVRPIYFHPNTRKNEPVVYHKKFKGVGWEAELVFGYSPEHDHEWDELGFKKPGKFHPYTLSLSRQGLDVILNDRVIMFHRLSELGIVQTRHNNYNSIRGEIVLLAGFTTAITKNSIIENEHWSQCLAVIKDFLAENHYIRSKTYPDALPEAALRDRLAHWLKTNDIARRSDVKKEYAVEGLGGKIDVLADGEAWEIKREDAYGLDVYQLFGYLDMTDFKKGWLLARDFKDSAYAARDHINNKHEVEITLTKLEGFPINQPLTEAEIAQYL